MQRISGIYNNEEFQLQSPYFSRDDDELNIIQNPIRKENISKVPMLRASSWKGKLSSVALDRLREKVESNNIKNILRYYLSYTRVFGTGSKDFRKVEKELGRIIVNTEKEINYDIEFIEKILKDTLEYTGIGAKTKFGWDRGKVDKNGIKCFKASWGE